MSCTTKPMQITCDGGLNDDTVTVIVCFEPPRGAPDVAIAWQVKTFSNGFVDSTATFTWTSDYAFSAVQDPNVPWATVTGLQQTTMTNPGGSYTFTPASSCSSPGPRAYNGTNGDANIGWGFVYDLGGQHEQMQTVGVFNNVKTTKYCTTSGWTPYMSIYAIPNYSGGLKSGDPITSALPTANRKVRVDLRQGTSALVTYSLTYDPVNGYQVVPPAQVRAQAAFAEAVSAGNSLNADKRQYNAKVDFTGLGDTFLVSVSAMATNLITQGYEVAISLAANLIEPVVDVALVLPYTNCLAQAEADMMKAIGGFPGVAILQRSGQLLSYDLGSYRGWNSVSPASDAWVEKPQGGRFVAEPEAIAVAPATNGAADKANGAVTNGAPVEAAVVKTGTVRRRRVQL